METSGRRADATIFGFEFQTAAAIVLFIENMKDVKSLRLEGCEDIHLNLNDGQLILAQAKAVQRPREDFSNVTKNLKKALTSLSEAGKEGNARALIYITNSIKPFGKKFDSLERPTWQTYDSLTKNERSVIDKYLDQIEYPLEKEVFRLEVIAFDTDDDREKYKYIKYIINKFLVDLRVAQLISGDQILDVWQTYVFKSGTKRSAELMLSKEQLIWILVAEMIDSQTIPEELSEEIDEGLVDEVSCQYKKLIRERMDNFEFTSKVLSDFQNFRKGKTRNHICLDFSLGMAEKYLNDLQASQLDEEMRKILLQIILYLIVSNRIRINQIKNGVGL